MIGYICWELSLHKTCLAVRSVEVDLRGHSFHEDRCFIVGDNGLIYDVSMDSTWKSEALSGSKVITLMALTVGQGEAILLSEKVSNRGIEFRMVVKLQGEPTKCSFSLNTIDS